MNRKKQVRAAFRSSVFRRDRYQCVICEPGFDRQGGDGHRPFHSDQADLVALDAHHITDRNLLPNGGYVLENGITLGRPEVGLVPFIFARYQLPELLRHPGQDAR